MERPSVSPRKKKKKPGGNYETQTQTDPITLFTNGKSMFPFRANQPQQQQNQIK
jgi:hypothetical protein